MLTFFILLLDNTRNSLKSSWHLELFFVLNFKDDLINQNQNYGKCELLMVTYLPKLL